LVALCPDLSLEGLRFFEDYVKIDIRFIITAVLMLTILFMRNESSSVHKRVASRKGSEE